MRELKLVVFVENKDDHVNFLINIHIYKLEVFFIENILHPSLTGMRKAFPKLNHMKSYAYDFIIVKAAHFALWHMTKTLKMWCGFLLVVILRLSTMNTKTHMSLFLVVIGHVYKTALR